MQTFIRAVEVWVPGADGSVLEFGSGLYGHARRFGSISRSMCFGRGEGLPGEAWDTGRPIVLKQFTGTSFRRIQAAAVDGLTCGIALPVFAGNRLTAVLVIFCGDHEQQAGAIEVWHNDSANSPDMALVDGHYGATGDAFEFMSRHTSFRKGNGLPGLAWESGLPVYMSDLGKGTRFLRADSAVKVGINRGFAIPCSTRGRHVYVMTLLSALATPIARRVETWLPDADGRQLTRSDGFCEQLGVLGATAGDARVERGQGAIGAALLSLAPAVAERAADQPGPVGAGARQADLGSLLALPVLRGERVAAVVAWYF